MFKKTKSLGKTIADRVEGYTVWEKPPKKKLKWHPSTYIICPDFKVVIPTVLSAEASDMSHRFTVNIVAKTRPAIKAVLNHMIACAQEDIIVRDKRLELCGFRQSIVKIGVYMADLTYTFKLRQLSYEELRKIQKTEEKDG